MNSTIVILIITLTVIAGCEESTTSKPTTVANESVPGHLEPNHLLYFQNGYVRVAETYLEPGDSTLDHSHPIEAAVIFLTDAKLEIRHDDGSIEESNTEKNTVAFGDSPTVHKTTNVGSTTSRNTVIEVFSRPPLRDFIGVDLDRGEVLLENEVVRMSRITIEPDETSQTFVASVFVTTDSGVFTPRSDGTPRRSEIGDIHWFGLAGDTITNTGMAAIEGIIVQIKGRE